MNLTNKHGVPDWLVESVGFLQGEYTKGESDYTATSLSEPPMITGLKYQYADQLEQDVADALPSVLGTAWHNETQRALENNERYIVERRFYRTIHVPNSPTKKDFVISGQIDLFDLETNYLLDHKVTSIAKYRIGDHEDWEAQASVNRWLMQHYGYEPGGYEIQAFLKDWRKGESKRDSNYPDMPFVCIPLPFWSVEMTEGWIRERVIEAEYAKQGIMRPCTKKERWQKDSVFAVMKKGRKSSVRNLSSREEAERYIEENGLKDHWVEERRAEATRCQQYCPVSEFCNSRGPL